MKIVLILISIAALFSACTSSGDKHSGSMDYADYFYPTDSIIPFIYIYQEEGNPLNEKMHRIYRLEEAKDTTLAVEYFNADFRITEGFSFNINTFLVEDHMIVDGDGLKRKAKLSSNSFFPSSKGESSHFVSDFPSHLDSIALVYSSKKTISDTDLTTLVLGNTVPAILVKDSITVTMVNVFTQEGSSQKVVVDRVFAKGYGQVEWSSNGGSIAFVLKKIVSNDWWEEVAQSPQVR